MEYATLVLEWRVMGTHKHRHKSESTCNYCDDISVARDHVIPRVYSGVTSFAKKHVVPVCVECNSLLSSRVFDSMEERCAYLYKKVSHRHKKLLASPDWTKEELEDIGESLIPHIKAIQHRKQETRARLACLQARSIPD